MRFVNPQIVGLVILLSILAAVPLTVIISQKQQELRQNASSTYSCVKTYYRDPQACLNGDDSISEYSYEASNDETKPCDSLTAVNTSCAINTVSEPTPVIQIPTSTPIPIQVLPTDTPIPTASRCVQKYGDECGQNLEGYINCNGICVIPTQPPIIYATPIYYTPTVYSTPQDVSTPAPNPTIATVMPTQNAPIVNPTAKLIACPYHSKGDVNCDNAVNLLDYMEWLNQSQESQRLPYEIISNGLLDESIPHGL